MDSAATTADSDNNKAASLVQHVTKKSSDELLRKFAELGDDEEEKTERKSKRRKRRNKTIRKDNEVGAYSWCETPSHNYNTSSLVERRSLLPRISTKSLLLRQLGIGRSPLRSARDFNNKSFLVAIEKTWRKTLEGASRVLMEKHYGRHKRLISDAV